MGACISIDEETLQMACASSKHKLAKRKIVMEMLNAEAKVSQILYKMPGRLCTNGSTFSACAFSKQGRKGVNQDCTLIWEEFAAQKNTVFCGIFDGHGPNGHFVARKVRDSLPVFLALPQDLLLHDSGENDDEDYDGHEKENNYESQEYDDVVDKADDLASNQPKAPPSQWKKKFIATYKLMDKNLKTHPKLHCFDSGTTAVTMIVQGQDLMIGNVGDSRAVLARRSQDGSLTAHQLTTDLKPNLPMELERIRRCKGRVFALEDEPNVARVWMPHSDMPGLAMARALGDFCLKEYGLSATPQVFHRRLTKEDEFVVLASDGIWDVLSNEDVVKIVASTYPKEEAAKALVNAAVWTWKRRHGPWRTDDCSVVCYFFKDQLIPSSGPCI
eukprot:c20368_g1_i1 orf=169-1329(+)